jgi:hypothetical protein
MRSALSEVVIYCDTLTWALCPNRGQNTKRRLLCRFFGKNQAGTAFGIALLVLAVAGILWSWRVSRYRRVQSQLDSAQTVLNRLGGGLEELWKKS